MSSDANTAPSPIPESSPTWSQMGPVTLSPKLWSYLVGQCCNVMKTAIWWTSLSPLVFALVNSDEAVGGMRVAFNIAMMVISPFAGVFAERMDIRKTLMYTTLGRGILWGVLLPLVWVFVSSGLVGSLGVESTAGTLTCLLVLGVLDGSQVAFSNIVDIDMGGVDILAKQQQLTVHDGIRNKMNSIHQMVFDGSMVLFAPAMAGLSLYLGNEFDELDKEDQHDTSRAGGIVGTFALVFWIMTVVSLVYYNHLQPEAADTNTAPFASAVVNIGGDLEDVDGRADGRGGEDGGMDEAPAAPAPSMSEIASGFWGTLIEGASIVWSHAPIRWRLIFLAFEVALEDTMVAVVVAEFSVSSSLFGKGNGVDANLWTAAIVAFGKVGAILAGWFMHSYWTPPSANSYGRSGYVPLFVSVFIGAVSTVLFPLAHVLEVDGYDENLARAVVFAGSFLFFTFSTAPKIGFETLLQALASKVDASGRIFGFVGTFITLVDSLVVMAFSLMFAYFKAQDEGDEAVHFGQAMWVVCGVYACHGLLEVLLGPALVLGKQDEPSNSLDEPLLREE